jgi:transposase
MAMGRQHARQGQMMVLWDELPRSPGHVFYDRLQAELAAAGFDSFVEHECQPCYARTIGAPSLPPGRYFRMHLVGYFEGIASERGLEWRCADSLSLRDFLGLELDQRVPDHSWLSRTRARLPLEVHERVFTWVLEQLAERGLIKGKRIGVDGSTMAANAAMRSIRRRDTGDSYREMLRRMAEESGVETPTAAELQQFDRTRKGKRTSNAEWASATDPDAKIARMKDGRTHLAYKPEHAVDLDTGAVVAAAIHPADQGDTTTLEGTLEAAAEGLEAAGVAPDPDTAADLVTDIGLEAGPLSQWLHAGLVEGGLPAICIETRHVKAALKAMTVKTDRNDARGMAQLMRMGWFRPVHVKAPLVQEIRALLTARKLLVAKLRDVESSLRGILRGFGLKVHEVVGIEEARAMEPRGADGFGPRVEHAELAQPIPLGLLGIAIHRLIPALRCFDSPGL